MEKIDIAAYEIQQATLEIQNILLGLEFADKNEIENIQEFKRGILHMVEHAYHNLNLGLRMINHSYDTSKEYNSKYQEDCYKRIISNGKISIFIDEEGDPENYK